VPIISLPTSEIRFSAIGGNISTGTAVAVLWAAITSVLRSKKDASVSACGDAYVFFLVFARYNFGAFEVRAAALS